MCARLQAPAIPGDPGGLLADEGAETTERLAPVSAISVPLWMRAGAVLSGETWRFVPGCASPGYRATGFLSADAELRRARSEEHTSELQSLMRISYAVFCLKKKKNK